MKITMFLGMVAMAAPGIVSAAGRESPSPAGIIVPPTSIYDYYGGHGHSMRPESWQSAWSAFGGELTCRNTGASGPRRVFYPLHVPDGHLLNYVDIWGWDNSARDLSFRVLKVCQAFLGGGLPVVTELATGATAGTPQRFHAEINIDPDDESTPGTCGHVVEARFTADGLSCAGPDLGVLRVRAEVRNPDVIYRDGFFLPRQVLLADAQQSGDE